MLVKDACVLAHLPHPPESKIPQQLYGATEEKTPLGFPANGDVGDGLNQPSLRLGEQAQRTLQRQPSDALTAMVLVHKYAMVADTPAAAVDSVVPLYQFSELSRRFRR